MSLEETIRDVRERVWSIGDAAMRGIAEVLIEFGLSPEIVGYSLPAATPQLQLSCGGNSSAKHPVTLHRQSNCLSPKRLHGTTAQADVKADCQRGGQQLSEAPGDAAQQMGDMATTQRSTRQHCQRRTKYRDGQQGKSTAEHRATTSKRSNYGKTPAAKIDTGSKRDAQQGNSGGQTIALNMFIRGPCSGQWTTDSGPDNLSVSQILQHLRFVVDNTFLYARDDTLRKQIIGIPMGTNAGPEISNLTLYWDEALFIDDIRQHDPQAAQRYAFTYRLIDDVLSWGQLPPPSEHYELEWKEITATDGLCTFLGMHLRVRSDGSLRMSVFDKAAAWDFPVIRYPSATSNIPSHQPAVPTVAAPTAAASTAVVSTAAVSTAAVSTSGFTPAVSAAEVASAARPVTACSSAANAVPTVAVPTAAISTAAASTVVVSTAAVSTAAAAVVSTAAVSTPGFTPAVSATEVASAAVPAMEVASAAVPTTTIVSAAVPLFTTSSTSVPRISHAIVFTVDAGYSHTQSSGGYGAEDDGGEDEEDKKDK
ncbi:hypothetical protein CBR_g40360 [Chara braunii]|uniref:Uncharacterized protein n=1 Tax=Chara braunii TaxID=69332 RepID=A0A388LTU3_CHABU|nr:hypothetical protein CBR_g40360 [Chara braunii]|eukprot:GBG85632.1 hypothetical protein CBR_g40360 [Chara braunii]